MPLLKRILSSFLFLLPFIAIGQFKEGTIAWSEDRRLTWSDYEAQPNPNSDAAALTTTYLGIQYSFSRDGFSYNIECSFARKSSWGRHKTAHILGHEQGHFDLAEYFARKLNKKMKNYKFNKTTYEKDLKKIYNDIIEEKEDVQNQYDRETNHSINKEKQAEWLEKIEEMLDDLKDYSDY